MEDYKGNITTRKMVMASFLTALSILFTRFLYIMLPIAGSQTLRLSFGETPIMISGMLFGPLLGGLTGIAADLIGVIINPQGAYFPGFTLSSVLWGVIPGFIGMYLKKSNKDRDYSIINSIIIFVLVYGLIKLFLAKNILTIKDGNLFLYGKAISMPIVIIFVVVFATIILLPILLKGKGGSKNYFSFDGIVLMVSISYIVIAVGLNTYWLSIMFKKGFLVLLPGRLLSCIASIPIHSMLIGTFLKYYKQMVRN